MHGSGAERSAIVERLRVTRRAMAREFLFGALVALGEADMTLQQLGVLILLDDGEPRTVTEIGELLSRSASATSRLIDQLVRRKLLSRVEDPEDRRVRRVSRSARGDKVIGQLLERRADAELALMEALSDEERALVNKAFALLGEAAKRKKKEVG